MKDFDAIVEARAGKLFEEKARAIAVSISEICRKNCKDLPESRQLLLAAWDYYIGTQGYQRDHPGWPVRWRNEIRDLVQNELLERLDYVARLRHEAGEFVLGEETSAETPKEYGLFQDQMVVPE